MTKFDVTIIGTGTAGQTAALELASEGYSVAIIEQSDYPGGVCALHGCQAKKYFYEVAELVARARHLMGAGVTSPPAVNWGDITEAKNQFTGSVPENTKANLRGHGVQYFEGSAHFEDAVTITAGSDKISADYFIIATGAVPMPLPLTGSEHLASSNDFLAMKSLPERVVFVGGGFISFEFAHFAARLGCKAGAIHILEAAERPLGPFDEEMVSQLTEASVHDGIQVHSGVSVSSIEKTTDGVYVHLESGEKFEADLAVHGAGRIAATEGLGLDNAGIKTSNRGITVNPEMRTSVSNIFAIGDCADTIQLARVADKEAAVAVKNILAEKEGTPTETIDYGAVPSVLFTYPQLAMVGKTEAQLQQEGIRYWKSSESGVGWPTYKRVGLQHAGYKILVDANNKILGAHILSDNATGLINIFRQAILDDTDVEKLYRESVMTPYPSRESDLLYMLTPFIE